MFKIKIRLDKNLIKVVVAAIAISLLYFYSLSRLHFLDILSLKTQDLFSNISYKIKPKPREIKDVCVIAIDDESLIKLQKKWPWPRSFFAEFLDSLTGYNPKIISLDLSFIGESQEPADDELLSRAIKNAKNVILSGYIGPDGNFNRPFLLFRKEALDFGFINKPRDKDFIVRSSRVLFRQEKNPKLYNLCFGLKSALYYLSVSNKNLKLEKDNLVISLINKQSTIIPLNKQGTVKINYQAKRSNFKVIPFYKIIKKEAKLEDILGKIAVVGVTAEIFHDVYHTPLGLMPGVILNANEILMYLSGQFITEVNRRWQLLLILLFACLSAILTYKLKVLQGIVALIIQLIALFLISLIATYKNISFDYFGPLFIVIVVYSGTETYKYFRLIIEAAMLKTMAITDGLTGLYVHRYLMLKLESEFNRAKEENLQLSFLIMDIDHFKKINDTYGHEEGNVILKHIAKIIQDSSRKVDIVARYGGEEFCAILPGTPEKGANIYAERLRKGIEEFDFPYQEGKNLKVTISIGIASLKQTNALTYQELIAFADKALYQAKETGRNKVCTFIPPENPAQK